MVGRDDDHCVIVNPERLQSVNQAPEVDIVEFDLILITPQSALGRV